MHVVDAWTETVRAWLHRSQKECLDLLREICSILGVGLDEKEFYLSSLKELEDAWGKRIREWRMKRSGGG
eukprot:947404-Prorocentrum_lima.AAC.1